MLKVLYIMLFIGGGMVVLIHPLLAQEIESDEGYSHHCLFTENSFSVGFGSGIIPSEAWTCNYQLRAYYKLKEHICFGPEIYNHQFNAFNRDLEVNMLVHYIIATTFSGIYPLVGSILLRESGEFAHDFIDTLTGTGLNRNMGKMTLFTEYANGWYNNQNIGKLNF